MKVLFSKYGGAKAISFFPFFSKCKHPFLEWPHADSNCELLGVNESFEPLDYGALLCFLGNGSFLKVSIVTLFL